MFCNSVHHWRVCTRNFKILNHNLPFCWHILLHTCPLKQCEIQQSLLHFVNSPARHSVCSPHCCWILCSLAPATRWSQSRYNMFDITQGLTYPNAKVDTSQPDLPSHTLEIIRNPQTEDPHEHCNLAANGSSKQGFLFHEGACAPELVDLSSIIYVYM